MSRQDCISDQFGDLGDYGVSERLKSVCSVGNPISHSTHLGFSAPETSETTCESISCLPIKNRRFTAGEDRFPLSRLSDAEGVGQNRTAVCKSIPPCPCSPAPFADCRRGVGHNPDSVAAVTGTNVGSWYAVPLRIIPERGQISENVSKPSTKQCCDVFHDDVSGCQLANQAGDFRPKPAALTGKPCTLSGRADILAGEPSADRVNGNSIGSKSLRCEFAHVAIAGDVWPVLCEDTTGELLNFAERHGLETARPLKAQRETADAAEQVEDAQLAHAASPDEVRGEVL